MFEFKKLCHEVESLTSEERVALLAEKSLLVVGKLNALEIPGLDPVDALVSFVVGSVVSDGSISEKDYLHIYPALEKAFGEVCDLAGIEKKFKVDSDVRKLIESYTGQLLGIISEVDEELGADIIFLCLLVTSVDGKVSLKEQHYIKQLCKS